MIFRALCSLAGTSFLIQIDKTDNIWVGILWLICAFIFYVGAVADYR